MSGKSDLRIKAILARKIIQWQNFSEQVNESTVATKYKGPQFLKFFQEGLCPMELHFVINMSICVT